MSTKTVSFKATEKQVEEIDRRVEEKGYTSRGELLRDLLREEMEPELTGKAVDRIKKARSEISEGKGRELGDN